MTGIRSFTTTLLAALLLAAVVAAPAPAAGPLTGPAEGTPVEIALAYLDAYKDELGLTAGDLADLVVKDQYVSKHTGVTHLYLYQRLGGVEVVNGVINVNVMPDGSILNLGNRFVPNLAGVANTRAPGIEPDEAIVRAAEHLGAELTGSIDLLQVVGGPAMEAVFSGAGLSHDPIPAKLMYLRHGDAARLVWSLVIRQVGTSDWWNLFVDAATGAVLDKINWTVSEAPRRADRPMRVPSGPAAASAPASGAPGEGGGCVSNCYNVFALPKESPNDGGRTIEDNPADPVASPFGWHDTNGVPGAEFTDSRGNNVEAQTDLDGNNVFSGGDVRSQGGASLIFDDPLDLGQPPLAYADAAVTNLFYFNNIMHDVAYHYGFDEQAGNFQQNNYGNPGAAGDPVQADAQDASLAATPSCNNANFATPPDGADPRMQMFVWTGVPNARLTVNSPGGIAGDYEAAKGCWGGPLTPPTTGDFELVNDGTGNNEGCNALIGFTPGNIALIDRGNCEFGAKAVNAQNAGATGAIIINDQQLPNGIIAMGAGAQGGAVTIPTVMIGAADGTTIRGQLPTPGVNGTIQETIVPLPDRDSDLDNGIIGHEYGHGISNRLVGGPGNTGCLSNQERMGEGWSDWWTLVLSADPADTAELPRGIGTYVSFQPGDGPGIRNFPYSTDLGVNPQTYGDVGTTNVPHGVGEIWNSALWEMYWLLVQRDGFDTDFYTGSGGNNLAIQLVMDGMKFTVCSPGFVDARDGILAADVALTGGANECEIWTGFAKRGIGFSAQQGDPNVVGDEIEAFDFPPGLDPDCVNAIFADGFESGDTSAWSGSVP